jgi:hypothetical protein
MEKSKFRRKIKMGLEDLEFRCCPVIPGAGLLAQERGPGRRQSGCRCDSPGWEGSCKVKMERPIIEPEDQYFLFKRIFVSIN